MTRFLLLLSFIFYRSVATAQHQADIWYFAQHCGLDFRSGKPQFITGGQITLSTAGAVASDANGNLLFYSDGKTIWNKDHQAMPHGINLPGMGEFGQQIVVPNPEGNLYYLFIPVPHGYLGSAAEKGPKKY